MISQQRMRTLSTLVALALSTGALAATPPLVNDFKRLPASGSRPRTVLPQGTRYLLVDVNLVCDSSAAAVLGGGNSAIFEMMGTFAEADRAFARSDLGVGATVRLRPKLASCFPDPPFDPFLNATSADDLLNRVGVYRGGLTPSSKGAITMLFTGQEFAAIKGETWLASLGTESAYAWAHVFPGDPHASWVIMAHELGHDFGADHDGVPGSPCASQTGNWILGGSPDTANDFSPCSRQSMGAHLATLAPPVYEASATAPPFANAGNDLEIVGSTQVNLSAAGSSDPEGQIISYTWQEDGTCDVSFSSHTTRDVAVNLRTNPTTVKDCRFLLTVTDGEGRQAFDSVRVRQWPAFAPPPAPVLSGLATSSTTALLTWTAQRTASSYTLFRSVPSTGGYLQIAQTTATGYTDQNLVAGTSYQYYVKATNQYGSSPSSNIVTVKLQPSTTTTLRVHYDVGLGNRITIRGDTAPLSWTAGQNATWTTGNVWTWSTTGIPSGASFQYKPLINDVTWSDGVNNVGVGGQTLDIFPKFNGR